MSLNKVVSLEYFKANLEEIENLKDKDLSKAILILVKFQVGNYLLNDTNTLKIDSISPHTVFAFNTALIKDISSSYDELEQSLIKVFESEYKDLIEDKPMINGREIFLLKNDDGMINVFDKDLHKYLHEEFKDLIDSNGVFLSTPYNTTEVYLDKRGLQIDFVEGHGKGGHELAYKNKVFNDNSKLEYEIKDKKTKEIRGNFLCSDLFKIRSNKIVYCDGEKLSKLDMSPRLNFIDTAYKELTGLNKYKFNIVSNKLQKFIYGYLTNETNYVRSEIKGKTKRTYNDEYNSAQKKGKELLEGFKEELEIFINKIEYSFKLDKTKKDILNEMFKIDLDTPLSQKTIFQKLIMLISDKVDTEQKIEDLATNTIISIENFYENINTFARKKEKNEVLSNSITNIPKNVLQEEAKNNNLQERMKSIISTVIANGLEVEKAESIAVDYDINNLLPDDYEKVSNFATSLGNAFARKINLELEKEFPYHSFFNKENNDRENDFNKIIKYLEGYSYIDYSISAYTKIRQNENIIKDEHDIDDINRILKNFISRTRAGIYDIKVDSFILNLRENNGLPLLNESFQKLYESDNVIKEIVDNLKENKYYDIFEFDKDFINATNLNENREINKQKLLEFSKGINHLNLPVGIKNTFKVRKLGNYGGKNKTITGLYSDFAGQITVDTRNNVFFNSVKHEEIHRMDLNNINKVGRNNLISLLDKYFDKKIPDSEMKNYYLIPEELIARAGEVTCMLLAGNYKAHYESFKQNNINEKELWENVKKDFENSKDYVLMKEFDKYMKNDEYIDFENAIDENSMELQLIEVCFEYYKPFFSNEKTDIVKLLKQSPKIGYENRQIEGLDTKKLDTSWSIYFNKKDKNEMLNLITKNFSITPIEIPNLKNIEKSDIRPLNEVLLDFANAKGDMNELDVHINGKGFETNPLESLEDDLLFATIKNKEIMKKIVKDNQINVTDLIDRIDGISKDRVKDEFYFELLDSLLNANIDNKEIKKFETRYKDLINNLSYGNSINQKEKDNFYESIAKSYGHREDSGLKNMGKGLYTRYCLGDDYSQSAKDFISFKFACESLKKIESIKQNNNELFYLENLVKYSKEFINYNSIYLESLLTSIVKLGNVKEREKLLEEFKKNTSAIASAFDEALTVFIFGKDFNKLTKIGFENLGLNEDNILKYAEKYRNKYGHSEKPYLNDIKENPFFFYEKFTNYFSGNNVPYSKLKFIKELIYEFVAYDYKDEEITNFKVPSKISLENKDLDFNKVLEFDKYAKFDILLYKNLFDYKEGSYSDLLKNICKTAPDRFIRYINKALDISLLQEDFSVLNEILKINIDENIRFNSSSNKISFNIDNIAKKTNYELENKVVNINEDNIVFIDENFSENEGGYRKKSLEILKAFYALENEDYSIANQRFYKFGENCGGLFIALKDNYNYDYFSKYNEIFKDKLDEEDINDFEKITFSEEGIISKLNKYIEHYFVNSKLDKHDKLEKKEFIRQICIFSNKIDEDNIIESIQTKRVGKNVLNKIFDEEFLDYWNAEYMQIAKIELENSNTNLFTMSMEDINKVKEKANSMLNKLDFLSVGTRKKMAINFNKTLNKSIVLENEISTKYKDLNRKIDFLMSEHIDEYIDCKTNLYEMYVYDFIVNNKDSKMVDTLVSLDNKMKFHLHRKNSLMSGTEQDNKKADIHKETLLNGIKFINKIIENPSNETVNIYPCRDFIELAKNISNKVETTSGYIEETTRTSEKNVSLSIMK